MSYEDWFYNRTNYKNCKGIERPVMEYKRDFRKDAQYLLRDTAITMHHEDLTKVIREFHEFAQLLGLEINGTNYIRYRKGWILRAEFDYRNKLYGISP